MGNLSKGKISVEIEMFNGDSVFSEDERGIKEVDTLFCLIFAGLASICIKSYLYQRKEFGEIWFTPMFLIVLSTTWMALHFLNDALYLQTVEWDDRGEVALDVMSFACYLVSRLIFSLFLLLLAFGWTLKNEELTEEQGETILPVSIFVGILEIILGILNYLLTHESERIHDYHGIVGVLVVTVRLSLYSGFVLGLKKTR